MSHSSQIVFATPAGAILPLISSRAAGTEAVLLSPEEVSPQTGSSSSLLLSSLELSDTQVYEP